MSTTRNSPQWRDDLPRSFRFAGPPHVPSVRRRRLSTALLIPRLVALSAYR